MYKQGDQHVVIGVVSFSSSPPTDASNLNLLSFESLFGWKEKCGEVTAFCEVPHVRTWVQKELRKMNAEYCHYGLNAGVP